MVEPEIAENTVPATMAMTESRPGTRRISRAKASIALSATPVWNSTSPISTKNGIGVSEKLVTDCTALRASWAKPGSPPRNSQPPTMLSARNANATGSPRPMRATRPPNRTRLASAQPISADRGRLVAPGARCAHQALKAEHEFERDQREADRQRRKQPPFGKDEILDGERAEPRALCGHHCAVPHQHEAGGEPDEVRQRFHRPGEPRRHDHQHHIDAHVLATPQQARRGEQRDQIERIFGDFVRPGKTDAERVAYDDVGRHQRDHREEDERCDDSEKIEK